MTGVELPLSAGEELATAAWAVVEAAERMRMHWAETPDGARKMSELWTPLHTAADTLRDRLEMVTCRTCRAQLTDCEICVTCDVRQDAAFTRRADR